MDNPLLAIFFDLDGTALDSQLHVTPELYSDIQKLKTHNYVSIATGRSVSDAYRYYKKLGLSSYIICYNGAFVWNPRSNHILYEKYLENSRDITTYLLKHFSEYGIKNILVSSGIHTVYLNRNSKYLDEMLIDPDLPAQEADPATFFNIEKVHRIVIQVKADARELIVEHLLSRFSTVDVFSWKGREDIIDISMKESNKWDGIEKVLTSENLSSAVSVTFGDARNDIQMLEKATIGVAVKNAPIEVQGAANYITFLSNDQNGIHHFITQHKEIFNI